MSIIDVTDLPTSLRDGEMVADMVAGANARAARVAPCLISADPAPSEHQIAEARLILLGAVKRWAEAGSGAFTQQTAGPFSVSTDSRQRSGFNLWPSEITDLQAICSTEAPTKREAFSFDTAPSAGLSAHLLWCDRTWGTLDCSCGVDIAGKPIFELG